MAAILCIPVIQKKLARVRSKTDRARASERERERRAGFSMPAINCGMRASPLAADFELAMRDSSREALAIFSRGHAPRPARFFFVPAIASHDQLGFRRTVQLALAAHVTRSVESKQTDLSRVVVSREEQQLAGRAMRRRRLERLSSLEHRVSGTKGGSRADFSPSKGSRRASESGGASRHKEQHTPGRGSRRPSRVFPHLQVV